MQRQRVLMSVDTSGGYGRGVLRGASTYARQHGRWALAITPIWALSRENLDSGYDGVLIQAMSLDLSQLLADRGTPAVNVADNQGEHPLPTVRSDHIEIAMRATEHLLVRGFKHLAFCGDPDEFYSVKRYEGFRQAMRKAGLAEAGNFRPPLRHTERQELLGQWLMTLPRPCGVMGCNDVWAHDVILACQSIGLRVPEDIAVVGVDNDELVCELAEVPISSVAVAAQRIGYQAATILAEGMAGRPMPSEPVEVPPMGVVTRQSSDILAIADQEVARAVQYIRDHAHESLNVEDVLRDLSISRRQLEQRFQTALGRSPASEIRRVRVERAKHLLEETDVPLGQIALDCGFTDAARLSKVFGRETGMTPSRYRMRSRLR